MKHVGRGTVLALYLGLSLLTGATSFSGRRDPVLVAAQTHAIAWDLFLDRGESSDRETVNAIHQGIARRPLMLAVTSLLVHLAHVTWPYAFALVRLASIVAAYLAFPRYLRIWFPEETTVLGTLFVAASVPLTFATNWSEVLSDFPELLVFTLAMGCLASGRPGGFALATFVGTLNRETAALLVAIGAFYAILTWMKRTPDFRYAVGAAVGWLGATIPLGWWMATGSPLHVYSSRLSWLVHNLNGLGQLLSKPHPYNQYLFPFYLFGAFWLLPFRSWRSLPTVLKAGVCAAPLFLLIVFTVGALNEPRELAALYPILVPASLFALFPPGERDPPPTDRAPGSQGHVQARTGLTAGGGCL